MKDIGIKTSQPNWYVGTTAFNIVSFGNSINHFSTSLSSTISANPKGSGFSSGGGSSGGGDGGSW